MATTVGAVPVERLDASRDLHETAFDSSKSAGSAAPNLNGNEPFVPERSQQREIWRHQEVGSENGTLMTTLPAHIRCGWLQTLAHQIFANHSNLCFANAAVGSFLWTTLSLSAFEKDFWGKQCKMLTDFLEQCSTQTICLDNEAWFVDVLRCWGRSDSSAPEPITQQDSAEFVSFWLAHMGSTAFDMARENRVEHNGEISVTDHSASFQPICLKFDTLTAKLQFCTLSSLLTVWRQVDGMCSALLRAPPCLCVQIDRMTQDENFQLHKCLSTLQLDNDVLVPTCTGRGLRTEFVEYLPVAVMAHFGLDNAGHYKAAWRVATAITGQLQPTNWLLADDWTAPAPTWQLDKSFRSHITMAWLIRSDCVHMIKYQQHYRPVPITDPAGAILAMFPQE